MKTCTVYNAKGGMRFIHDEPYRIGDECMHVGQRVKIVGQGMAGMPEVESADGYTCLAFPHDLKPIKQSAPTN